MSERIEAAQRWSAFLEKVRARLGEILAEADAGLDEIIATEVLDPGPYSSAVNEVKARLFALEDKIDPAWKKLEAETSLDPDLEDQGRALGSEILQAAEDFDARTQKKYRARLWELAQEELKTRKLNCSKCAAPLPEPEVKHRVENVTCPHCQAVNTVRPSLAMAMLGAQPSQRNAGPRSGSAADASPRRSDPENGPPKKQHA